MKFRNLRLPRPVRWLIDAAGILLVVGTMVIGLASTAWFRHMLQTRVESTLSQITGGKVEIQGMGFRPLRLRVSARRLIIHGREKDGKQPLFSARNVVVNVSPDTLIQLRLLLRTLAWQQAELHVRTYPDGSTNLPGPSISPAQGQGLANLLDLGVEHLTLSNTTLYWNNQRIPIQVLARDVAIQLHVGQNHDYPGTLASSGAVFTWKDKTFPPLSFATSFTLSRDQVAVPALSWQIGNLQGHLAGTLHWLPQLAASFEFRTSGGLQELARTLRMTPLESGYLYVDGKGAYGEKGFSVKGRMQARQLKLKTPRFKPGTLSLAADYQLSQHEVKLANVTLAALGGRAQGEATVSLGKTLPRVSLHGRLKGLSLSALMEAMPGAAGAIGIFHPQTLIDGTVNASWQQPSRLRSRFDLQFSPPADQAATGLPLSGHAQGSIDLGRDVLLTLDQAQISTPHSTFETQGTFGAAQSSLAVKFTTSDFAEWRPVAKILIDTQTPPPITLHSLAVFTGKISGTFSSPEIDGQVTAGSFNYGGWVWDSFQAGILASPQQVRIQSGRLKLGTSSLTLNVEASLIRWKLEPYSAVRLQATAVETPLAGLRATLNLKPSMKGLLSGQVQAQGTVESLSGHGQFTVRKGEIAGVPFDSLSANVLANKSAWEVSGFQLVEGHGRANGQAQINPAERTFSAKLHGQDYPLDRIHFLKPQEAKAINSAEVSGLISFDLDGDGTFDNARVHSTLQITKLAWKGQSLGSVQGDAEWQGRQVTLQIKGGGGQAGNFQVSGNLETGGNWPLRLSGQYADFRADPWIEALSGHSMGAEISASGSFTVSGPLQDKSLLAVSSQLQRLQINFPAFQLSNQGPVEVSYAAGKLEFKQFRLEGQSTNFQVDGSIRFGRPVSLDLSAKGKAAATLLSLFESGVQATGESDMEVRLRGTLDEPQLSGRIEVKDVGLGYRNLPFRLSALNGTINLQGERAVISSLKGTLGGGTVNLTGFLVLQQALRYQIRAELSQARVRYPSDFTSVLDGKLMLAGTSAQGQLSGDISVRNLFANESLNLIDLISGPGNLLGGSSPGTSSPFASSVNVNVNLSSFRPVRIETHDLSLVSDIELHLQGTLANPVAVGNVYLRSGQAIFRGSRYTLTRGDISMTNPFQTEPVLDLQVHSRVDKYDLTLEVTGPPDQIRFAYRSDPPLPTEDILSLLAFGYSKRLEEFAPETRNPFSSMGASALLSQALSSQVSGRIQRLFGVSRIKLSPTSGVPGTLGGPVLTVEQQLSSNLTLTYQTSTANSQYRVIEFEYTVSPRLSVRGFRDQNGIFGLELKFRKRFK